MYPGKCRLGTFPCSSRGAIPPFSPFDSLKEFSWLPTSFALLFALFAVSLVVFTWSCNELTLSPSVVRLVSCALLRASISVMSSCSLVISSCSFLRLRYTDRCLWSGCLHSVRSEPILRHRPHIWELVRKHPQVPTIRHVVKDKPLSVFDGREQSFAHSLDIFASSQPSTITFPFKWVFP